MAEDATPFDFMRRLIRKLRDKWLQQIEETAPKLAEYFAQSVNKRVDADLKKILRDGGFLIKWTETPAMRDVRAACIAENVSLIKSIPARYFEEIEGVIARGFAQGFDLKTVTDELQDRFRVSRKRAAFIARDQGSKLSSQLSRVRATEQGLFYARWSHSRGGKTVRKTHRYLMDGQEFDLREGLFDPDPKVNRHINAGELINCRCVARIIVPDVTKKRDRGIPQEEYKARLKDWKERHAA